MNCDNEIKKNEIANIYRIEYMPSSNWTMGYKRKIWIVTFDGESAKRSLYIGEPLVPEYSKWNDKPEISFSDFENGEFVFVEYFPSSAYLNALEEAKTWRWADRKRSSRIIDGTNLDIAFFTRDSKGNDKICRYQAREDSKMKEVIRRFNSFFRSIPTKLAKQENKELVILNKELMSKSSHLLPGGYEDGDPTFSERVKALKMAKRNKEISARWNAKFDPDKKDKYIKEIIKELKKYNMNDSDIEALFNTMETAEEYWRFYRFIALYPPVSFKSTLKFWMKIKDNIQKEE